MIKPELFDVVELLINLPDHNLQAGEGAIVEEYSAQIMRLNLPIQLGKRLH